MSNPTHLIMSVLWLALIGVVIVIGGRAVSKLQSKAGV